MVPDRGHRLAPPAPAGAAADPRRLSIAHLEENLAAAGLRLSEQELGLLPRWIPPLLVDRRRHTMAAEETDLPKVSAPARRALLGAGYTRLEHLTEVRESEVMRLHGMGPNAMRVLRDALHERGLSFRDG
jgi:hypothetical protein